MNTTDRDAQLTAYALNDPGLNAAERAAIEAYLATEPDARRAVAETQKLAALLTAGLLAEAEATPAGVVTVPAAKPRKAGFRWTMAALAAAVLLAVGGVGYMAYPRGDASRTLRETAAGVPAADSRSRPGERVTELADRAAGPAASGEGGGIKTNAKPASRPEDWDAGIPAKNFALAGDTAPAPAAGAKPADGTERLKTRPDAVRLAAVVPPTEQPEQLKRLSEIDRLAGGRKYQLAESELRLKQKSDEAPMFRYGAENSTRDAYAPLVENPFVAVEGQNALSTFGLDVDTASYSIVRKYITAGQLPPKDAVRLEELVNYFPYRDAPPDGDDPYTCRVELTTCPWQPQHHLARIAVKAKPIANDKRPPSNLVFLIDVSGSMNEPNKLPLVKASLKMLANALGENDRVAMVVYAGQSGLVLDSTNAMKKDAILSALDRLEAGGSTNGAGGLRQAYDVAVANFIKGGTNRVILCTDGDWNVGTTGTQDLIALVEEKRKTGVFLSVLGYGMGNLRDEMMVNLAGKGNGNYAYIDTAREANKALVEQIGGTLVTVAKDVKVQVEFNPAAIRSYRLLGYEKRILAAQDFADDTKDAGEMGAGHVVTALYELVPVGAPAAAPAPAAGGEGLRYQDVPKVAAPAAAANPVKADEAFLVKMRHKKPDADRSTLREMPVRNDVKPYDKAGEDFRFAASVAGFALLLRDSPHKGGSNYGLVLELAESAKSHDPGGYRTEFVDLVRKAKQIAGK